MPADPRLLIDRLRELESDHRKFAGQCIDAPVSKERFTKTAATLAEAIEIIEIWNLIEQLRDSQPSWVTIYQDNEEPPPNCAIEVGGEWTNYEAQRIDGDSIKECLQKAITARANGGWRDRT